MSAAVTPGDTQRRLFEQWFAIYGRAVFRTCFLYLADRDLAEDAWQDTFLKAWNSMARFEKRSEFSVKAWLMKIAMNTCHDYKRSKWFRYVDLTKAVEDLPQSLQPVTQESRELFIDVLRLPEKFKRPTLLYYYQELTLQETAQILGISRQAVYRRLKKAHELLRYCPEGREQE